MDEVRSQADYRCRFDWGPHGAQLAAQRGDVLVVVDTLRFSTACVAAVNAGVSVYPCPPDEDTEAVARVVGGEALSRKDRWLALSPLVYGDLAQGSRIVVPSPNGAMCALLGRASPWLFAGALVNARATAEAVRHVLGKRKATVIACGEREGHTDGDLRLAIEDLLGAGAVIAALDVAGSPEAQVAQAAFEGMRDSIENVLWESISGRELRTKGRGEDVIFAARIDTLNGAAVLHGDHFELFRNEGHP